MKGRTDVCDTEIIDRNHAALQSLCDIHAEILIWTENAGTEPILRTVGEGNGVVDGLVRH